MVEAIKFVKYFKLESKEEIFAPHAVTFPVEALFSSYVEFKQDHNFPSKCGCIRRGF